MEGIIKIAPKNISEFNGHKTVSFQIEGKSEWYKYEAAEDKLKKLIELMTKGTEVKFTVDKYNTSKDLEITKIAAAPQETKGSWQNEMINFEDLLEAGHKKGIKSIKTTIVSADFSNKQAIVKVELVMKGGNIFEATGDASPESTTQMITPHFLRMAETRALARALRFATNNAQTCELETDSGMTEEGLI